MRKKIFQFFFWLFRFKKNTIDTAQNGTIIVLIDGLSLEALLYAIKIGYSPFLKKMGISYSFHEYYCGLPAATTATEALLFYGNNDNIPGFTWYDRSLKNFVRGNRSLELAPFEDRFEKKRDLMKDGSVIMGVYSGGATELSVSGRNLTFSRSSFLFKMAHYIMAALLYPTQLIRTVYLTLKTIILYRKSNRHTAQETLAKIVLGQFSCFLTEIEIMRNTKKIFVDFLLYDEYAHEYGPTHPTTLSTLRLLDRYIKRIVNSAKKTDRKYDFIILSDHGQTDSIPYDFPNIISVDNITKALNNATFEVVKTYGGIIPQKEKRQLYVVPAGSTLQLYFSHSLDQALNESEINNQFPSFIENILRYEVFGWVLVRKNKDESILYGKEGAVHFHRTNKHIISGKPFPLHKEDEINKILSSFQDYSTFSNNGDIVLFGNSTKDKKVYSFEKHKGTHGGFYGPMTHPFYLSNNPKISGDSMKSLFDTIALDI